MYCSSCGTNNLKDAQFCLKCGGRLADQAVSSRTRRIGTRLVFALILPWTVAVVLGGYLAYVEVVRVPSDRQSVHDNAIATQKMADAHTIMGLANTSEQAGMRSEAAALWVVGDQLANEAADAWEKVGNAATAQVCREAAVSHIWPTPTGSTP